MIQQCCLCKKVYGQKEPMNDPSVTHGYCGPCTISELEKLEKYMQEKEKKEVPK